MTISERAARLHSEAIVIDGHSDHLMAVLPGITSLIEPFPDSELKRWQTIAANQKPVEPGPASLGMNVSALDRLIAPAGQYELPLLVQGGVTAECMTLYLDPEQLDTALATSLEMVAKLHQAVIAHPDKVLLVREYADIQRAKDEGKVAYILTMEGAEPIGDRIDLFDIFYHLGLRMATLTHSRRNLLADGTQMNITTGGLTRVGRRAVQRCNELGIVLDTAHISDQGFWELMELSEQPVLCSHTSVRHLTPGYRAPWREHNSTYGMSKAEAVAKKNGLIGAVFISMVDIAELVDEVQAIIESAGEDHVGIGTDFCGMSISPEDLQHIGELPKLTDALCNAGLSDEVIIKVLGGNYQRIFKEVWKN